MAELFQCFPHLMSERLIIRKMIEYDIDSLSEITNNEMSTDTFRYFYIKRVAAIYWQQLET